MTHRICFWNEKEGKQDERDSTPEEDAQQTIDIAEHLAAQPKRQAEAILNALEYQSRQVKIDAIVEATKGKRGWSGDSLAARPEVEAIPK